MKKLIFVCLMSFGFIGYGQSVNPNIIFKNLLTDMLYPMDYPIRYGSYCTNQGLVGNFDVNDTIVFQNIRDDADYDSIVNIALDMGHMLKMGGKLRGKIYNSEVFLSCNRVEIYCEINQVDAYRRNEVAIFVFNYYVRVKSR
jgi:hypothetical protein